MSSQMTNFGTYEGTVVNNNDPLRQGRLQLNVPQVLGSALSNWAIPSVPALTIPKVAERVWVHFAGGDTNRPVYAASGGGIEVGDTTDGFFILPTGITAYHNGVQTLDVDTQGNVVLVGKFQTGVTGARVEMVAFNPVNPGAFDGNVITLYTGATAETGPAFIEAAEYSSSGGTAPFLALFPGSYGGSNPPSVQLHGTSPGNAGDVGLFAHEVDIGTSNLWIFGADGSGTGTMLVQTQNVTLNSGSVMINPTTTTTISGQDFLFTGGGTVNLQTNFGNQIVLVASGSLFLNSAQNVYVTPGGGTQFTFNTHDVGTTNNPALFTGNGGLKFVLRPNQTYPATPYTFPPTGGSNQTVPEVQSRWPGEGTGGGGSYGNFTANAFLMTSSRMYKTEITPWQASALDYLRKTTVHRYRKLIGYDETNEPVYNVRHNIGPVLDEMPEHVRVDHEVFDIGDVLGTFWKAFQELADSIEELDAKIEGTHAS